jgi:hypothetical protein
MRNTESIVEEYRKADLEKRLYLFLECPVLRATFTEIDQSENATARPVENATASAFPVPPGKDCGVSERHQ